MLNVADALQSRFDAWLQAVTDLLGYAPDGERAFNLFWIRMSPEDASEVLRYTD